MKFNCSKCNKKKGENRLKQAYCLKCQVAYNRKYRREHPEETKKWDALRYQRHKERYINSSLKWQKENPKAYKRNHKKAMKKYIKSNKFKASVLRNYYSNKQKWFCRKITLNLLKCKNKKTGLKKECKICGATKSLQIHHEVYLTKSNEIRKAIKDGKIYYLCRRHHNKNT
jgi:hypothetical protein